MSVRVIALNCSLKRTHGRSSTARLLKELGEEFAKLDASFDVVRVADLNIAAGVSSNEGEGDDWPEVRRQILAADILIVGTPIWLGHASSLAQRVCERMDAFLGEKRSDGSLPTAGKLAGCAVVGNEDGAHAASAALFQALNDVGFTISANAVTYWVGEAMGDKNYVDLPHTPRVVAKATRQLAVNAVHLARQLKLSNYPAPGSDD